MSTTHSAAMALDTTTTALVCILATMASEDVRLDTGRSVDTDTERDRFNGDDRPRCIYRYHVPVKVFECRMNRGRKEGDSSCEGKSWFVVVVVCHCCRSNLSTIRY